MYTRRQNHRQSGSILVGVLITLFLMSVIVMKFIGEANREIQYQSQFQGRIDLRSQAYSMFDATLACLHEIKTIDGELYRSNQGWANPLGYAEFPIPEGLEVEVKIRDETGKLPIEHNDITIWKLLFEAMGIDLSDADELTDTLIDWMDKDDLKRLNGAEKDDYELEDKEYKPSNEILKDFDELRHIKGFDVLFFNEEDGTPNQYYKWFEDSVSLYNTHPVNVNTAQGLVSNILARMGGYNVQYFNQHMNGPDGIPSSGDEPWITDFQQIPGFGLGQSEGGSMSPGRLFGATSKLFDIEVKVQRGGSVFLIKALVGPKGDKNTLQSRSSASRSSSSSSGKKDGYYPFEIIHLSANRIF